MFWNVFELMGCCVYKLEYTSDLAGQTLEAVTELLQKFMAAMKSHQSPGDFGWSGIYG